MNAAGGRAVFVIDHLRHVIDRNAAAEALLGDELRIANRQLQLAHPATDGPLQHLVALATLRRDDGVLPRPVFTEIKGAGALMIDAVRVPPALRYFHSMAAALVVVRPVGELRTDLPSLLKQRLNFTGAEIRVALALFEGRSPAGIAEAADLSVGTVRQQIKSLLRKSGTSRQAELMAVMRRLADRDAG
jgi:DNA-binding CsgD family transcriptional regulator